MTREGEIKGIDDHGIWEDGSIGIVSSGVQMILPREGISRSHLHPQGDLPNDVKVLEKEGPVSLVMRKLARILEVGQVLMVSEDRDRMGGALQVLFPFCQGKDDGEKLSIIDIIVLFSGREGL